MLDYRGFITNHYALGIRYNVIIQTAEFFILAETIMKDIGTPIGFCAYPIAVAASPSELYSTTSLPACNALRAPRALCVARRFSSARRPARPLAFRFPRRCIAAWRAIVTRPAASAEFPLERILPPAATAPAAQLPPRASCLR